MNDYDVVFLDDERNAIDRRRVTARPRARVSGSSVVVPAGRRPTVIYGGGGASAPAYYQPAAPMYYDDPRMFAPGPLSRFGNLSTAELIELGSKLLAAILPLPAAPTGQGEVGIDVENLLTYQSALATYAKRDEQLRTLGDLLGKILR